MKFKTPSFPFSIFYFVKQNEKLFWKKLAKAIGKIHVPEMLF